MERDASADRTAAIEVRDLVRKFDDAVALDGVTLRVEHGEFFALLGPSGCGKTTLLRLLAGLDSPDGGSVAIGGRPMAEVPAHRRPVNTVFQSYALFPHLDVRDNTAFGLRMKRVPEAQVAERVSRALDLVQIGALARRRPAQLSGGQQQRVALARALVNEPEVLLLDEPLGALDLKLRKSLQLELLQLQRRLGITFVLVTHDQEEALGMADRIAVMRAGRIEQVGLAAALYERPRTRFVGQFLGSCNLLDARIETETSDHVVVATALGILRVARGDNAEALAGRSSFTLAIRPEKLAPSREPHNGANRVPVVVEQVIYGGTHREYRLSVRGAERPDQLLSAYATSSGDATALRAGDEAWVSLPPSELVVLED